MIRKILIVDDEPPARENMVHLLCREAPHAQIEEAGDGIEAARLLEEMRPQLLFLDIQMPGLDGLQLMRFLPPEQRPVTVFVTAHREFAADAFDLEAVDYLVKPFRRERFGQTMQRVKQQLLLRQAKPTTEQDVSGDDERLRIKDGPRHIFVVKRDIDWVAAAGNYVEIHSGGTAHLMRTTMKEIQKLLPTDRFVRIHRGILLNRERIHQIKPTENGDYIVHLRCGKRLAMSRRRKTALRQLLE